MSQYAGPLDFVAEVRDLARRIKDLETRRRRVPDTDWQALAVTDLTNFDYFAGGSGLRIRAVGRVVQVVGGLSLQTAGYIDSTSPRPIADIPADLLPGPARLDGSLYRAAATQKPRPNGSFQVAIRDTSLIVCRFGPDASTAGEWLPIDLMWLRG